ncbi:hypothetical protein PHYBOEH_007687 [Phytophthora boehmeriae]|uniref:Bzip transcription factor n=1 Tax=Phytophthora boehmeriae TaxID=109152 RepID=A0A8T1W648_9STRA|nr:hypothetical protein PHYBOEH_007687 [Phytophthora boehmeriae]
MSDSVIGAVIPRQKARDFKTCNIEVVPGTSIGDFACKPRATHTNESLLLHKAPSVQSPPATGKEKEQSETAKLARRREQLRLCQARFRQKQRDLKLQEQQRMKEEIQQVRDGIKCLKLEHRSLKLRGKFKPSPFNVVSEVLHFIDTTLQSPWRVANTEVMKSHTDTRRSLALLQTVLTPDVAMGELRGFDVLMEQLQRYSQYFGEPRIQLERIETLAPGVLRATTTLSLTITETTMKSVFQLPKKTNGEEIDKSMWTRLEGKRICCSCSINFLFDKTKGLVERLELCIDLLTPLVRELKSLEGVVQVLEKVQLNSEGVLLGPSRQRSIS